MRARTSTNNGRLCVERLVTRYGCSVEVKGKYDGMTALHWAAYHGLADVVELLLKLGANKTAVSNYGETPLASAQKAAQEYAAGNFKVPSFVGHGIKEPCDFKTRDPEWPQWERVIRILSGAEEVQGAADSGLKPAGLVAPMASSDPTSH